MPQAYSDEQESPRMTPAVQWLMSATVAVYFLQITLIRPEDMQGALGFAMRDLASSWWRGVTYMFVHRDLWHLLGNMYMLWLFGRRLESVWGSGKFTRYFLLCGLGGAAAYLLFSRAGLLIGGSAAVYGVMLAYAMMWKDEEMLFFGVFPVKVWHLVLFYAMIDTTMALYGGGSSRVAHWAHLGGFVTGWIILRVPPGQSLDRLRQRIAQAPDVPDETPRAVPPRSLPRSRPERQEVDDIVARSKAVAATKRPPVPATPARKPDKPVAGRGADELNLILDKISANGMSSLTTDERRVLEEASKRLRANSK